MSDAQTLREELENHAFFNGPGTVVSTGAAANQIPFYVGSEGDLNFGYGYDVTKNGTTGLQAYLTAPILSLAQQAVSSHALLSQLNQLVAQTYGASKDWRPAAQ